jgi:hypothetical protein
VYAEFAKPVLVREPHPDVIGSIARLALDWDMAASGAKLNPVIKLYESAGMLQCWSVGDEVIGEPVGDVVGNDVVGEPVGDEVGDDVVGEVVGDVVGDAGGEAVGLGVVQTRKPHCW